MGAAVKISSIVTPVPSGSGMLNDVLRALPSSFEVDLQIALRFDMSMPSVRLAHLLVSPLLARFEGVPHQSVFIVFGYAVERLIRLSVAGLTTDDRNTYRDRYNAFLVLEKASRCLQFNRVIGRSLSAVCEETAGDCFPVGKVIFESADGSRKYEVDGMAMRHLGDSLGRMQMSHVQQMLHGASHRTDEYEASIDYLRYLSFASNLQEMGRSEASPASGSFEQDRSRLLRQLYRYCMAHVRKGQVPEHTGIRRLMHRIEDLTSMPGIDVWNVMNGQGDQVTGSK